MWVSISASSIRAANAGGRDLIGWASWLHQERAVAAAAWAKAVPTQAETMQRYVLPASASALAMIWERQPCPVTPGRLAAAVGVDAGGDDDGDRDDGSCDTPA